MNAKEYMAELVKSADVGLDDAGRQAVEKFFANDKVSNAFVPRPEVDRSLDNVKKNWFKEIPEANKWYNEQLQVAANNEAAVNEAKGIVQRYVDTYGELSNANNPDAKRAVDAANFISKKEHEEALGRQGIQYISVLKNGLKASNDYWARFKEPLDVDALEKFALEKQLPLEQAYQAYIQPKVSEAQDKTFAEKLKAAKDEGYKEGLSKGNVPIDSKPKQPHPVFDSYAKTKAAPAADQQVRANFAEAWNSAAK